MVGFVFCRGYAVGGVSAGVARPWAFVPGLLSREPRFVIVCLLAGSHVQQPVHSDGPVDHDPLFNSILGDGKPRGDGIPPQTDIDQFRDLPLN